MHTIFWLEKAGKRPLGRHKRRLEGNIKIDLKETGWEVVEWIHLVQDRNQWWTLMNIKMNLWVP